MSFHPNFESFSRKMRFRGREAERNLNRFVKRTGNSVFIAVDFFTPVDTGRAVSSWFASLDSPRTDVLDDAYVPGGVGPLNNAASVRNPNLSRAQVRGINSRIAIILATSIITARMPEQDIWIVNNLDYIGELNRGFSPQAPAGYVQIFAQQAVSQTNLGNIFEVP